MTVPSKRMALKIMIAMLVKCKTDSSMQASLSTGRKSQKKCLIPFDPQKGNLKMRVLILSDMTHPVTHEAATIWVQTLLFISIWY